ncbi:MAG: SDR family oxidoreductase [Gemmatimonadales bacterium]|nr:SDR family oxidoreductase [Gemmatimonadales bacterium]
MDLGLKGKTALVTAGSRGFGKAVARELAAEGARIAICARGEEDLEKALAEIQEAGQQVWGGMAGHHLTRALDVTDDKAVGEFIGVTEKELGPIDLLLVNAGGPPAGDFFTLDLDKWQEAYRLTVESAVRLCRLVMPGMIKRRWGRIVQITSVSVLQPVENLALSSVLRPAVQALTRNLALEGAPFGVTVNSVAPGYHTTSAVERLITAKIEQKGCTRDDVLSDWAGEIPMGRLGEPEELAALVLFLMSERASYITGQCLVSDGGWVRGTF